MKLSKYNGASVFNENISFENRRQAHQICGEGERGSVVADVVEGADMADVDRAVRFGKDSGRELETDGMSFEPHEGTATNGMIDGDDVVV